MAMSSEEMVALCKRHTLYTWAVQDQVDPLPIARAQGIYFWTPEGKRFIDFNSTLMSVLIGHSHPKVIAAMKEALDGLIFAYPQAATETRARLSQTLARLTPGDIDTFFFTTGGAEANENAIKIARTVTGRFKILSRYRSYHGATHATMQLSGDPRRWGSEPGAPGFLRMLDPVPLQFSFGTTDEEITRNHLTYLEELIQYENPKDIAAIFVESVTGTNGVLIPPRGWMKGLRELTEKHGILLVCDEVMSGFGRTGKMFAFEHGGILPDIVTMAKGLTSSYMPLGAVGVRQHVVEKLRGKYFAGGLTYNSHNLALACAEAVLAVTVEEKLIENAVSMEKVMRAELDRLAAKHPSFKEGRLIGLFGMVDIRKNSAGDLIAPYNGSHPAMARLAAFFREQGLFSFQRWSSFSTIPPLTINAEQIREAFAIIDRGLDITDAAFEG
ncbi:MAG: aminotransferase class III-fold pyridoxal phosphate-dependent enzyme [Planctomycetes bacterium]|nr:aminotransferase class III-fold pyridoxal phosphate-dependent enzyme [Planctomycetota bacterium]